MLSISHVIFVKKIWWSIDVLPTLSNLWTTSVLMCKAYVPSTCEHFFHFHVSFSFFMPSSERNKRNVSCKTLKAFTVEKKFWEKLNGTEVIILILIFASKTRLAERTVKAKEHHSHVWQWVMLWGITRSAFASWKFRRRPIYGNSY